MSLPVLIVEMTAVTAISSSNMKTAAKESAILWAILSFFMQAAPPVCPSGVAEIKRSRLPLSLYTIFAEKTICIKKSRKNCCGKSRSPVVYFKQMDGVQIFALRP
jgi:hypothetical protein